MKEKFASQEVISPNFGPGGISGRIFRAGYFEPGILGMVFRAGYFRHGISGRIFRAGSLGWAVRDGQFGPGIPKGPIFGFLVVFHNFVKFHFLTFSCR